MDTTNQELETVYRLAQRHLDGELNRDELRELESLLAASHSARRAYCDFIEEAACLRWLCAEKVPVLLQPASLERRPSVRPTPRFASVKGYIVGAVCVLVAAFATWQLAIHGKTQADTESRPLTQPVAAAPVGRLEYDRGVATFTNLESVRWSNLHNRGELLARCEVGDRVSMVTGAAQLTFDAGVQVTVFGPADFEITSPTSIRCRRGRVTALVNERGKGFTIQTPNAKVVDLGTQFGMSISDEGETEVVVFKGSVDLTPLAGGRGAATRRMSRGEALLLKSSGQLERVMAIRRNSFLSVLDSIHPRGSEPVISDVHDTIRSNQSSMSYQIVHAGLEEDAPCFVDRGHQWNGVDASGIPHFLNGADYVMPFNDDKFVGGLKLTIRLARPAALYVFLDNNMDVPQWLEKDFTDTGLDIGMDGSRTPWHRDQSLAAGAGQSIDCRFSVWKRVVAEPGLVTLGGIEPPAVRSQGFNMYGIAAKALP